MRTKVASVAAREAQWTTSMQAAACPSVGYPNDLCALRPGFRTWGMTGKPDRLGSEFFEKIDTDSAVVHQGRRLTTDHR